ncbi:MAG: hypothetical protein ABH851_01175 [Methanobacteriota archaeon]
MDILENFDRIFMEAASSTALCDYCVNRGTTICKFCGGEAPEEED